MAGTTPIYGFPYPESSDLVANYPALGQQLAEDVEDVLSAGIGKVLQVVTAEYSTLTSTTSTSYVTTGLTATITPSSTSSKVYATATTAAGQLTANQGVNFSIFRGTAAGTKVGSEIQIKTSSGTPDVGATVMVLDSPATASAQIYTLCMAVTGGTGRAQRGGFNAVMVLMEVAE